ncbi:MAG: serine/threonine-protein kinase RsbW [Solirubrobacteraceae bacterium]|jgi:anti-sigma regulatory factor (Ser/Thr protein kinase)|nr:serine/threonine-protein kinase RsbW [Solirubrobacteraceae bacterium]
MQIGPALIAGSPDDASGRRFQPSGVSARGQEGPDARCDVHLTLPASAANVVVIRRVIGTLAEAMRMSLVRVEDVKLAVTEACTNVVRHAYPGEAQGGMLDVVANAAGTSLTIIVSDDGGGFQPRAGTGGPGLGLPLMAAIAREFEIEQDRVGGTRVRMSFPEAE